MKKGFTLIELLGVIALLAVIILVAVPAFVESNRVAQANEEENFNKTIEIATKDYINSCSSLDYCLNKHSDGFEDFLSQNDSPPIKIEVSELIESGFLKEDLKDPSGNKISGNVNVKNNNGKLEVTYGG